MQRPHSKNNPGPTKAERDFQGWVKQQNCCVTGAWGVHVHHCKGSTFKHNKVLIGHWFCLPLCPEAHQEYHDGSKPWTVKYGLQSMLCLNLMCRFEQETGNEVPFYVVESIRSCGK
ncbi:MAG: hypothetical protein V3R25_09270 [Nitrosomonadaceae bacterium]